MVDQALAVQRRRSALVAALVAAVVLAGLAVALSGGGGSGSAAAASPRGALDRAATVIPSDALADVSLALGGHRPPVAQALAVARRLPDFPLVYAAAVSKLGTIISGGRPVDVGTRIAPWLGDRASLALLDTTTATAGTLVVVAVTDRSAARAFVRSMGAAAHGRYRGIAIEAYPDGSELTFLGEDLVIGQDASVRAAIDVATGHAPSLAKAAVYRRAVAGAPAGRALDAYASAAGVQRVLAGQGGVLGELGTLLSQPSLAAVAISVVPTSAGARLVIHSALSTKGSTASPSFDPTLASVMPAGAGLLLDVTGLGRALPQVLDFGTASGATGGIGTLLSRLGSALTAEGVKVSDIVSIFQREAAVGILKPGASPVLVVVARAPRAARTASELSRLEAPFARLFAAKGRAPAFHARPVAGVTAHQLVVDAGLQLDYAVFRGLVVVSTSLDGIAAVARPGPPLSRSAPFTAVLGDRPATVTSLVYADLAEIVAVAKQSGLSDGSLFARVLPDLRHVTGAGLTSSRGSGASTTQVTIGIR
ncbi:MAG TPA: DUF3352 domain-containing protein [Solirubrobacteraceae bacterium]|nr:DUF3352 domain-containing protein [Solirubrobacteraceae bacterium]